MNAILKTDPFFFLLILGLLVSCSTSKKLQKELETEGLNQHHFSGILILDPKNDKVLIEQNADRYFTPASNTKLATFYAARKHLGDSTFINYRISGDSIILYGEGAPLFLYDSLGIEALDFIRSGKRSVFLVDREMKDAEYGDGWSWDDYPYYYMPERSLFPIYGNRIRISKDQDSSVIVPRFFQNKVTQVTDLELRREWKENSFYLGDDEVIDGREVPFITSNQLTADLLSDEIGSKVTLIPDMQGFDLDTLFLTPFDTLYTRLLVDSDNFIAEQLLLQVGRKTTGEFSVKEGIKEILEGDLQDLPQRPKWVDGSGLSRYNLFTPASMVHILKNLYEEVPHDQLFNYFPKGGVNGTLESHYKDQPYIMAKSGTLSNNYCLSGYIRTRSGKILLFSYMTNHYIGSSSDRKKEISTFLEKIHKNY